MTLKYILKILLRPKFVLMQLASLLLQIASTGVSVLLPLMASMALDQYFLQGYLGQNEILIVVIILFLILIIPPINSWLVVFIGENISLELKNYLLKKTLNFQPFNMLKIEQSKIYTIISNDVNIVKDSLVRIIPTVLMSLILLVGSIVFMYRINAKVSVVIFIVIPSIAIIIIFIFRKLTKLFKRAQEIRDKINKTIDENIKASMLVRVFVAEDTEEIKFNDVNKSSYDLSLQIVKQMSFIFPILNLTMYMGQLIVLLIGGAESIEGRLSIGEISAFNNYVLMFTAPFLMLSFMSTIIGQSFASLGRINALLSIKNKKIKKLNPIENFLSIEFKNFELVLDDKEVLHDINFKINKGQRVGIIGITGSGKTIFTESLLKFVDEYKGKILFNGKNIEDFDFENFRKQIGYIPQRNFILSDSIYNNIDFYRTLDSSAINKAADTALVTEFTKNYKNGLDHHTGERGVNLSGGQKQRITIARALAGNPQILILDDSTSKLDMNTENQIMENFKNNYPDLTIIIIAQKIASIKSCDNIYVMEDGTFEINGNHEYLMQNSFLYKEIDLTQSNYSHE